MIVQGEELDAFKNVPAKPLTIRSGGCRLWAPHENPVIGAEREGVDGPG
jgi:hypothetical protein